MVKVSRTLSFIVGLVVLMLIAISLPGRSTAQADQRCFPETNQCISGVIRQYWESNGGLPVFGFPITALAVETNIDGFPRWAVDQLLE